MANVYNEDLCRQCAQSGQETCCQHNGCAYLPSDFESLEYEDLYNKIYEGNITIRANIFPGLHEATWSFFLYLKARNINEDIVDFYGQSGQCKMLTETGCFYSKEERPAYGRGLQPIQIGGPCHQTIDDIYTRNEWIKYQPVLTEIVKRLTNRDALDIFIEEINKHDGFLSTIVNKRPYLPAEETLEQLEEYERLIRRNSTIINQRKKK